VPPAVRVSCTHGRLQVKDGSAPSAVKAVGNPQDRRKLAHALPVDLLQPAETLLGRLRIAPPVVAYERGEEGHLRRLESSQFTVFDQVGRVAVVPLAGNVLSDVVQ